MANAIEIPKLNELIAKLASAADLQFVQSALEAGALYLKGKVATYPAQKRPTLASVYGKAFKTDRQRKAFFAMLRRGEIEVPYVRGSSPGSETLGRKWTIAARSRTEVVLGNNVSYGPLVQSRADQSMYMAAVGWKTIEDVIDDESATVIRQIEALVETKLAEMNV